MRRCRRDLSSIGGGHKERGSGSRRLAAKQSIRRRVHGMWLLCALCGITFDMSALKSDGVTKYVLRGRWPAEGKPHRRGRRNSKHPPKAADPRCLIANGAQGRGAGAMICGRRVFRD
jgi:hypothetical protein